MTTTLYALSLHCYQECCCARLSFNGKNKEEKLCVENRGMSWKMSNGLQQPSDDLKGKIRLSACRAAEHEHHLWIVNRNYPAE